MKELEELFKLGNSFRLAKIEYHPDIAKFNVHIDMFGASGFDLESTIHNCIEMVKGGSPNLPAKKEEEATYSIKEIKKEASGVCKCGHSGSCHGSNGKICARCECTEFEADAT